MYESNLKIFWVEVFAVGYSVVSIRANVIFRKRSEFEIQFYPIVLSFTFKSVQEIMGTALAVRKKERFDNTLRCSYWRFFKHFGLL